LRHVLIVKIDLDFECNLKDQSRKISMCVRAVIQRQIKLGLLNLAQSLTSAIMGHTGCHPEGQTSRSIGQKVSTLVLSGVDLHIRRVHSWFHSTASAANENNRKDEI